MSESDNDEGHRSGEGWHQHWTIKLMVLGIVIGALAGLVVLLFRMAITEAMQLFTTGVGFEGLSPPLRLILPAAGGLAVGLLAHYVFYRDSDVGVSLVLERIAYAGSRLRLRGALAQFLYGVLAIGSGHSVGREGPSIHMGAAIGSFLGQKTGADSNHMRILVAAGAAGAFAGALDIPLAGVVFVLEVILSTYSLMLFAPVAVATVVASTITQLNVGEEALIVIPAAVPHPWWFAPMEVAIGLGAAIISYFLLRGVEGIHRMGEQTPVPPWALPAIGGLLVGSMAAFSPGVMGVSYHLLGPIFSGEVAVAGMAALLVAKLVATIISLGTQSRGGAVGPALFLGALLGVLTAESVRTFTALEPGGNAIYGIIGMAAGVAAILNAPFTATVAAFELVREPDIIPLALLATVSAAVTSRDWFKAQSIFAWTLHLRELSEPSLPERGQACTVPVNEVMHAQFRSLPRKADPDSLRWLQSETGFQALIPIQGEDGRLEGVLTFKGLMQAGLAFPDEEGEVDLVPYMEPAVVLRNLYPGDSATKALDLMASYGLEGYPVSSPRDADYVVGLIHHGEALEACYGEMRQNRTANAEAETEQ